MIDRPLLQLIASTQRRGAEVFATDLGQALRARGRRVETVALAASTGDGLDVPALGARRLGPASLGGLARRARSAGLVVAHGSTTLEACAVTVRRFLYRNIGDPRFWSSASHRRVRTTLLLRRPLAVAVLWPGAADALMAQHGVPASKIRVIPNGVPAARCPRVTPASRAAARRALGLPAERRVLVYLGALSGEKGVGTAIDALGAVPDVELVVAGDGPQRSALEARAGAVAPGRVRFVGTTPDASTVLSAGDALVLPSRTEGLPGVLIEAGLSGIPVVATDVGGVREIVVDGETGVLVPVGDAGALAEGMRTVLADAGGLGDAAHRRCLARFEIGVVAALWDELIDEHVR